MLKESKKVQLVKIRKLPPRAVFRFVNHKGESELWKVEGRPTKIATSREDGRQEYVVFCVYQKKNKNDQAVGGSKLFNIEFEVEHVADGGKTFDALDRRDQPDEVQSIGELARQNGATWQDEEDAIEDGLNEDDK